MNSAAHQNPRVTTNTWGNVADSYKNVWMLDEKRQILEWLYPLASLERHQTVCGGRVDGVGDWVLQTNEFKKWHTSEDGVNPVLFCYGDPGVGKTYMSSLVIDTLHDRIFGDNVTVACVYCDFHAQNEKSAATVLGALLKQVVEGMETIPNQLQSAFESAKRQLDGRTLRLPQILSMLLKSLSPLQQVFICIDALDEFPAKNRPELWESLQNIVRECPTLVYSLLEDQTSLPRSRYILLKVPLWFI
ncbi:hypothetical protein L873DRAFT_1822271 [Choiromyces venosus 120613-1]|uniref:Nephrocystin 3-like N-terminal domain-containing protein n=1 Tax=Choiromyces venosus 120613-1 TaxID=1336337 RepID=A0A3N4IZM0_9PEZI|nr:hypothetical protein L873DRAFT_1822271 [Choiromyces venosus 120613-1]